MIRRKLRRILGIKSPAQQLLERRRQIELEIEAEVEAYRRRLLAVCAAAGLELLPWQADAAAREHRRRLQWQLANPSIGQRVKFGVLRNETGNDA